MFVTRCVLEVVHQPAGSSGLKGPKRLGRVIDESGVLDRRLGAGDDVVGHQRGQTVVGRHIWCECHEEDVILKPPHIDDRVWSSFTGQAGRWTHLAFFSTVRRILDKRAV